MKIPFLAVFLCLSSFFCFGQTFTWTGNQAILDNQSVSIPIPVSGIANAINDGFGLARICVDITHPYDDDIKLTLISPSGMSLVALEHAGGAGSNFLGTCLGMDGVSFTIALPPYTGLFYPTGNLSSFNNGQNPNGTWQLIVTDISAPDEGVITSASVVFVNNPPTFNPSPGSGAPTGTYVCASCVCPDGSNNCDLLPDMTSSFKEINLNHTETPGFLYISNATPNIGWGPLDIYGIDSCFCGDTRVPCNIMCPDGSYVKHYVKQRVYQKRPGTDTLSYYDRLAGKMTFHPTHNHLHVDDWANYSLRVATSNPDARTWPIVSTGIKQSYCLINLGNCANNPGECVDNNGNPVVAVPNHGVGWHSGCGLNQGIYPGMYDVYSVNLNDPIPLQNVCNGNYYIVSITDAGNAFLESDETNNWVAVPITLTQQNIAPIITPSGDLTICQGESLTLTASTASNYQWSNGGTTQSIQVSESGTYSVATTCGNQVATSQPVTVNVIPVNSVASISISQTFGSNPTCPGVQQIFTAVPSNGGTSPAFQWLVNGNPVGSNSNTWTTSSLNNNDVVTCRLTSSVSCLQASPVFSNPISMVVNPPTDPTVSIAVTAGDNPSCTGNPLTFSATLTNGSDPVYQWKLNGDNVGSNSPSYSSNALANGDGITCFVKARKACANIYTLGTGTTTNDFRSNSGAAYPTYYGNGRQQYIIRAAELNALGLSAGQITALTFTTGAQLGNPATLNGYTIKLGTTAATQATGNFLTVPLTTVFGPVNYTPTLNSQNFHQFSTPFTWDGYSNLVVDICFENQAYGSAAYQTYQTQAGFLCSTYYQADNAPGAGACSKTTGNTGSYRPNMIFTVNPVKNINSNQIDVLVTNNMTFTFIGSGNWNISSNWLNNAMPPAILPSCGEIIIDPPSGEECLLSGTQTIAPGGKIRVKANKKFRITGNLDIQ